MGDRRHRVLLVEDDRFQRKATAAMRAEHGFETLLAADGEEALREARTAGAVDYLVKAELSLEDVITRVRAALAAREEQRQ